MVWSQIWDLVLISPIYYQTIWDALVSSWNSISCLSQAPAFIGSVYNGLPIDGSIWFWKLPIMVQNKQKRPPQKKKILYFEWSTPWHFKTATLVFMSAWSCQVRVDIQLISWNASGYSQLHGLTGGNLLTFFLTYLLTFFLTYLVPLFLTLFLACLPTFCLAFFLTYLLTFFLTYLVTFFLAYH